MSNLTRTNAGGGGVSSGAVQDATHTYAPDAEASDAYAIALDPTLTAYVEGQEFTFKANTANTGASSLNVDSLGAKAIKKNLNEDTETGDIESGSIVTVVYDGTIFQVTSIGGGGGGDVTAGANIGDNLLVRGDGSVKGVQNTGISISDTDVMTGGDVGGMKQTVVTGATYDTIQEIHNVTAPSGCTSGGVISNNGDGTIAVTSGTVLIRATDTNVGTLYPADFVADSALAISDNTLSFIYVEWVNATTSPVITVETSEQSDHNSKILLGVAYRDGLEIHVTNEAGYSVSNGIERTIHRFKATEYFQHASGGALSETGTRNIAVSAGTYYEGLNEISTIAQDTSGSSPDDNHTFEYLFYNGSAWVTHESTVDSAVLTTGSGLDDATSGGTFVGSHTLRFRVEVTANGSPDTFKYTYKANDGVTDVVVTGVSMSTSPITLFDGVTIQWTADTGHTIGDIWTFDAYLSSQIDATQYNNTASGLATLSNNQYGVHWVYVDVHGHLAVLFGQASYTLSGAENALSPASVPAEFEKHSRLIGKIIIGKSDSTFTTIENNYNEGFQGSVATDHGGLIGLSDDDHTQYLLTDGSRTLTGDQDFGATAITTTGVVTGATVEATGDTSAGDNSALGYTATEGAILTGQGSTYDVVIKNDADANVIQIPTGGTIVQLPNLTASEIVITDANKGLISGAVATYPSLTELAYVKGVTSAIQTQINAKGTGTMSNVVEDTTPQLGGDLDLNDKRINLSAVPTTDHTLVGTFTDAFNAGATISAMKMVYFDVSAVEWLETDASAVGTAGTVLIGIALEAGTNGNAMEVGFSGYVRDDTWAWTIGAPIYLSETAGALTQTAPTTTDAVIRVVGFAVSADVMMLTISPNHITVT